MAENHVSLSAQHIVKRYGGVLALSDGSLEVQSGEVVALLGANGSGKSTLSKVITGVVAPNEGQLILDGQPVVFASPQGAKNRGIAVVYQELSLIPDMTVAENIWLSHQPLKWGIYVDKKALQTGTQELIDLFAGTVQPSLQAGEPVSALPPDERQIVEILKALSLDPRLIILDEATASLDSRQVNRLFDLIENWKEQGKAIVFVSHRMDEIFRIADRAVVLRNGRTVGGAVISETDENELVNMMVGDAAAVPRRLAHQPVPAGAPIRLRLQDIHSDVLQGVSLEVHDGELLGIGGLQGQGQSNLLHAVFGDIPFTGDMTLSSAGTGGALRVHFSHPRQAMEHDIAFVPGDRGNEGLLLIRSILENIQLPSWKGYGFPLRMEAARADATQIADDLSLVRESLDAPVSSLSGGNAQKVVIGKWLLRRPKLLLLNDPTKGVDVHTKREFYNLLAELRQEGTAILFYSSDDEELLGLCDRVLVLLDGRISAELSGETLTHSQLVSASMSTGHLEAAAS